MLLSDINKAFLAEFEYRTIPLRKLAKINYLIENSGDVERVKRLKRGLRHSEANRNMLVRRPDGFYDIKNRGFANQKMENGRPYIVGLLNRKKFTGSNYIKSAKARSNNIITKAKETAKENKEDYVRIRTPFTQNPVIKNKGQDVDFTINSGIGNDGSFLPRQTVRTKVNYVDTNYEMPGMRGEQTSPISSLIARDRPQLGPPIPSGQSNSQPQISQSSVPNVVTKPSLEQEQKIKSMRPPVSRNPSEHRPKSTEPIKNKGNTQITQIPRTSGGGDDGLLPILGLGGGTIAYSNTNKRKREIT